MEMPHSYTTKEGEEQERKDKDKREDEDEKGEEAWAAEMKGV